MGRKNWPAELGDEDFVVPKISDLGASVVGSDTDLHQLPFSRGWVAPEWHGRFFQVQNARRMDVFSFGLIVYWILAWDVKFSRLSVDEEETEMVSLTDPAMSDSQLPMKEAINVLQNFDMTQAQRGILAQFFTKTLASDLNDRARNAQELLPLLDGEARVPDPSLYLSTTPTATKHSTCSFRLVDWIGQLSLADFRVREHIFEELKRMAQSGCSTCRQNCSLQLAVCCELGFGTKSNLEQRDTFLVDGGWLHEEYLSELNAFLHPPPRSLPSWLQYLFQADLTHEYQRRQEILTACEHLKREIEGRAAALGRDSPLVTVLGLMLAGLLDAAGMNEEALAVQIELYARLNSTLGPEHPEVIAAMSQLALVYHNAGHAKKALTTGQDAYDLCRRVLGETDRTTITSMANLAIFLYASKRYTEAVELQEQVVRQHENVLGMEHPDTVKCCMNEAVFLQHSVMGVERAVGRLHAAIKRLRNSYGFFHRDAFWALTNYMDTLEKGLATRDEALETREAVYSKAKQLLGSDHHETWVFGFKLASTLGSLGDWDRARNLFEEARSNMERLLGPTHDETLRCLINFAKAYQEQGFHKEAYDLLHGALGPNGALSTPVEEMHDIVIECLRAMGRALEAQHKSKESKAVWQQVLTFAEKRSPENILNLEAAREATSHLASLYAEEGQTEEGSKMLRALTEWGTRHLDQDSFEMMCHENNVACQMIDAGRYQDALEILSDLRQKISRLPLPIHDTCQAIMLASMRAYYGADEIDQAISVGEDYLPKLQEGLGNSHDDTMTVQSNLSVYYMEAKSFEKAEETMLRLNQIYEQRGNEHMCLITMHNLAVLYQNTGRIKEAIGLQRQIMERRGEFSGKESEMYLDDAYDTADILSQDPDSLEEAARWVNMAWECFRARDPSSRLAVVTGLLRGHILRKTGDVSEARESFEAVILAAKDAVGDNKDKWTGEAKKALEELAVDGVTNRIEALDVLSGSG
jgi:tetratricopeptide (TPR) repeat protein